MKTSLLAAALMAFTGPVLAQMQTGHQQHHPAGGPATPAQAQSQAQATQTQLHDQVPMGQMMQTMPEQCRAMMQNMPQGCTDMMQHMMQGGMTQAGNPSEAARAYMAAMDKMESPMIQALREPDPDVAFVKGMIPHHQSAIDMAKVVLQYGKDEQAKTWANDVIREQQREITEMQEWLKKRGQ